MLKWMLAFVPAAVVVHYAFPDAHMLVFLCAAAAVIPLAAWLSKATEHLADRTGEAAGGLLNATFGNAAELIIALVALHDGLYTIVKASLTGSILGNLLLVMGAATFGGGLRHKTLAFNPRGARVQSTLLMLAAIALIAPAAYDHLVGPERRLLEQPMSAAIAVLMLAAYGLGLLFSLHTHRSYFSAAAPEGPPREHGARQGWSMGRSLAVLGGSTALIAWISEILVGSVKGAAASLGMTDLFIGLIVVAIIGNAAEHSSAITVAMENRMDLSLGIAVGSSIQVALFVAPVLVLASYLVGPRPMDLVFTPAEVGAVGLSVVIAAQISADGESNWLEGVLLLAVYVILAIVFYFLPG